MVRKYYLKTFMPTNKFDNLDEMDKFFEKCNLL